MTATMSTEFERAARVYQVSQQAKRHGELTTLPEPQVIGDHLSLLVSLGLLTAEQAHQLWQFLQSGGGSPLPPIPGPDPKPNADLYAMLRLRTLVPHDGGEHVAIVDDVAIAVATAVVTVAVPWVVQHAGDAWSAITGFFSGLFS